MDQHLNEIDATDEQSSSACLTIELVDLGRARAEVAVPSTHARSLLGAIFCLLGGVVVAISLPLTVGYMALSGVPWWLALAGMAFEAAVVVVCTWFSLVFSSDRRRLLRR